MPERRTRYDRIARHKQDFCAKRQNSTSITPLDKVSLDIDDGKIIGLVGASGEGKSTLANILCGICPPSRGKVYVDGVSLWSDKCKYDRKTGCAVQLIPQNPLLHSTQLNE